MFMCVGKKREGYILEMQHLRDGRSDANTEGQPLGSLTISDICLPLKRDFMNRIGTPHGKYTSSSITGLSRYYINIVVCISFNMIHIGRH